MPWAAPGVLRKFYTFRENGIISKTAAGEYALGCLPPRWHRIIREALNLREEITSSLYKSRIERALETVRLLEVVIRECNAIPR